jgi:hypothetical protein
MNCASCGRVVYMNQRFCRCGWKVPPSSAAEIANPKASEPTGKNWREIKKFIEEYKAKNPGASNRDACIAYMTQNKMTHLLPTSLRPAKTRDEIEAEREAKIERAAIQNEQEPPY